MKSINVQPIEKSRFHPGETLDVHSIFYTIQGEGPFVGMPAVFIRLAGCNLQCPMCDTDYTQGRESCSIESIIKTVKELTPNARDHKKLVVITGGEPFRQNIVLLIDQLALEGYHSQVETNGTLAPQMGLSSLAGTEFTIVCSPKTGKVNASLIPFIDAYKYVLHADQIDPEDGLPTLALNHSASPRVARPHEGFEGPVYIQPVDEKDEALNRRHLEAAKTSALKFGHLLGLQIHKIINVE